MASSRSTRRGSQYLAADQELNIGTCSEHERPNEAFCEVCKIVVCPSCLMFGNHIGHKALPPGQAARLIRDLIDKANKSGKLNPDFPDRFLLEIRENKKVMLKAQNNVMAQIQESFSNVILALKNRRKELISEVQEYFNKELDIVRESEKNWEEKEKLGEKILKIAKADSDEEILINGFMVLAGIDNFDSPVSFTKLKLLENLDFGVDGEKVEDILEVLRNIGRFGDYKSMQFRA